jgi:hypothetical protein
MPDYNPELFKTEYFVDKTNHPDNEIVRFCGKDMPLGDIRNLYEKHEEKKYSMISFYDDMFQYTSLGLIDVIFDKYHINSPIPFKSFFNRKQTYGKEFVYEIVNRFKITPQEVDEIEKDNYEKILMRSPLSRNSIGYFKIRNICNNQLLILKYPFKNVHRIMRHIREIYGKDEYISLEVDYCGNKTEQEYLKTLPKSKDSYFDIVICQDAASTIEYIVAQNIKGSNILTPLDHNGLSNEAKYAFEEYLEGIGPNGCKLHYIKETI